MQVIHCDMDGCKNAEPANVEGGPGLISAGPTLGAPKGWAVIEWQATGKGEASPQSKIAAKYFEAIAAALPKPALGPDPGELLRGADILGSSIPELVITLR